MAGAALAPGALAYFAPGADELAVSADRAARALLVGGVPFAEKVAMW